MPTAPFGRAQTTQPYLSPRLPNGNTSSSGFVTMLRNGATGFSRGSFDVHAGLHHGHRCGKRPFPYFASVSTGQTGVTLISENIGQYLYLLKVGS
jgi:hypothetical protein